MKYILKGLSSELDLKYFLEHDIHFAFDLRPISLNFTQIKQISNLVGLLPTGENFSLMFDSDLNMTITETGKAIKEYVHNENSFNLEFTGLKDLSEIEALDMPYIWHYHGSVSVVDIKELKHLKRIVFHHSDLEALDAKGELYSFLNLFKDTEFEYELQITPKTNLLESMLDYFEFNFISLEIDFQVEHSFKNINKELILSLFLELKEDLEDKKEVNENIIGE